MRVMPIRIITGAGGFVQARASYKKNQLHYWQEAIGLAIFMISACFFSAMFFSEKAAWSHSIPGTDFKNILMGILMGLTALFIFYSPFTAPSGSQINPAVTLTFLRLGKMCPWDALFYIIFQFAGGTIAVYTMQFLMGDVLTSPPVNSAITIPGAAGVLPALITELIIAFATMTMVLFASNNERLKKYTRIIAGCFVCCWVIFAGPVSGFGMNPARTFASALPAHIWTAFWVYLIIPVVGMLGAAEFFLWCQRLKSNKRHVSVIINNQ